jgi:hypothetical protein
VPRLNAERCAVGEELVEVLGSRPCRQQPLVFRVDDGQAIGSRPPRDIGLHDDSFVFVEGERLLPSYLADVCLQRRGQCLGEPVLVDVVHVEQEPIRAGRAGAVFDARACQDRAGEVQRGRMPAVGRLSAIFGGCDPGASRATSARARSSVVNAMRTHEGTPLSASSRVAALRSRRFSGMSMV